MPRIARKDLNTSFFHIVVQGIKREYIFKNKEYMETYKTLLIKYGEIYNIKILAYCIMNNHAHVLIFTESIENMSKFMKCANTSYGHYYNKLEERVGFVFRDRYLSEPIYNEKHLFNCISYIHLNPVKAKMVKMQREYIYSSYNEYINKNGIITEEILKIIFGSTKDYLKMFLQLSIGEEWEFIDVDKTKENPRAKIEQYCKNRDIRIDEIISDEEKLIELINYLIDNLKLTRTDIGKALNVHRLRITRLLSKYEQK